MNNGMMPYQNQYPLTNPYRKSMDKNRYYCAHNCENLVLDGKGSVKVKPDVAVISVGVITENEKLETAQRENAIRTSKVIESIEDMGVQEKDIETQNYNITQEYDYIDKEKVFRGYRVTHNLKITIRDIGKTGEIIDKAVENGANIVNYVDFTISDPSPFYKHALMLAIQDAVAKASVVERSLNIAINKTPIKIVEETYGYCPNGQRPLLRYPSEATPIQTGEIEITACIKASFDY